MAGTPVPENVVLRPHIGTLRDLWPYLWPKDMPDIKVRMVIAILCLIAAKLATLTVPLFFKAAVDALTPQYNEMIIVPIGLIFAYAGARILTALFAEFRDIISARIAQRAVRKSALTIFEHLHNLSLRYHLERQTGGLSRAIERGTLAVENFITFLTLNILPTFVEILLVSGLMWVLYDYRFALITFFTMLVYIGFTLKLTEWRIHFVRSMNASGSEANTKSIDSLLNYETVKYFGNEKHEAKRFDLSLKNYEEASVKSKISLSLLNIGQGIIIALGLAWVMLLASQKVLTAQMTVGDFVAVNTFLIQLYIPLFMLGFAYREIKLAMVNMEEMFSLVLVPEEIKNKANAPQLKFKDGEIVFDRVSFHYQQERPILKNISFVVPAGKTVAIVGSSGAGKSTIGRLLFRFYDVISGAIRIDGQDIRDVTQTSLRQVIGVVPQDTVLFNDTIYYNIAYGKPEALPTEVESAAQYARIHDFIVSLPDGYQTRVGERGLKLSGGEKQRVAIARTLLKKPQIFLFDEATSALDTRTEKQIQTSLKELSANHTTLIVAHRLSTVIDADEILVLDHGTIVERGTHAELLKQKGLYAKMWQRQQEQLGE